MNALIITFLMTGAIQFANLGSGILSAHLLGVDGRGALAAVQLWPATLAYLLLFGLQDASLFFSANRQRPPKEIFAAGVTLGSLASVFGIVFGYFFVLPLAYRHDTPDIRWLAALTLAVIPCNILGSIFQEMLRGHMRIGVWNLLRAALAVGYPMFIVIAYFLNGANVLSFTMAFIAAQLLPLFGSLAVLLRAGWGKLIAGRATYRAVIAYGLKTHPGNVITMLNTKVDLIFIKQFLEGDIRALGLYTVSLTLSQITATLSSSVAMIAFPRASAAITEIEKAAVIGIYLRLTLLILLPATVLLWLLAPLALHILFGPEFTAATPIVRILILGILPLAVKDFLQLAFKAFDRSLAISKSELVLLILNIIMLAVAIPAAGLMGAAVAFVAARWLALGYIIFLVKRHLDLHIMALISPTKADWQLLMINKKLLLQGLRQRIAGVS